MTYKGGLITQNAEYMMLFSRLRSLITRKIALPPPDSWTNRFNLGLGSLIYGVVGGVNVVSWPMTVMMFDNPNWHTQHPIMVPVMWLGWIGFGPVCLFSSYQLGVAARYGYYAHTFHISFPLIYGTAYGCFMVVSEAMDKERQRKINEELNNKNDGVARKERQEKPKEK